MMNNLKNEFKVILRRGRIRIGIALIGPPQFSLTIEHRNDPSIGWTTALCLVWLAIFIDWNYNE